MKKILLILLLMLSISLARETKAEKGLGLFVSKEGPGVITSYKDFKLLLGSNFYTFDYEFFGLNLSDSLQLYIGIGLYLDKDNGDIKMPLGLDWQLAKRFDLFFEYIAFIAFNNSTIVMNPYNDVSSLGIRYFFE